MATILSVIGALFQIAIMFIKLNNEKNEIVKEKKQEVIDLTKQAFTGDIKDAKSKMAAAIDKLGDIK